MRTHAIPSVKVLLAKEAAKDAAERRLVRRSAELGMSLSSTSERCGEEKGEVQSGSVGGKVDLPYGEVRGAKSKRNGCREPYTAVSIARRAQSSSGSGGLCRVHGRVTYIEKNVRVTVMEVTGSLIWQKDVATEWNDYARAGFSNDVTVLYGGGNEAGGSIIMLSLQHFRGQALDETAGSGMEDVTWREVGWTMSGGGSSAKAGQKSVRKDSTTKERSLQTRE